MLTLLTLMMIPTTIMIFMKHPLSMGMVLLTQTVLTALYTNMSSSVPWYSYIMILIMIGGMLVLYMYMTSVASNEKFKFSSKIMLTSLTIVAMTALTLIINKWSHSTWMMKNESLMMINTYSTSLNKYLNFPSMLISMTLIIYLLVTLIAVIKITDIKHGPLRHQN
uniref:NADH-ubiquinone oxidoreductase chain 6 n=1 Tax=Neolucanus maximus TaxID=618182 RepID=A0A346TLQ3_9SCAR|nr:NADH dehydrogenase subunit 6 [Neolucanus maximus]AXU40293.1 NADH dehydrogenase subunit 6 [Neolucanus maximus]